jgi:hypothetical protein
LNKNLFNEISEFKNLHRNKSCLICGTGPSLSDLNKTILFTLGKQKVFLIGVNDIAKYLVPDYHVLVDNIGLKCKKENIDKHIRILQTNAKYMFSYYDLEFVNTKRIAYIYNGFNSIDDIKHLHEKNRMFARKNSIIVAISLAIFMGFKKIGIIGFDLRRHPHYTQKTAISDACKIIDNYCFDNEINIYNLSEQSLVTGFQYLSLSDFIVFTRIKNNVSNKENI